MSTLIKIIVSFFLSVTGSLMDVGENSPGETLQTSKVIEYSEANNFIFPSKDETVIHYSFLK